MNHDEIVILYCLNENCEHNLKDYGVAGCNLKRVLLDEQGKCQDFTPSKEHEKEKDKDK